MKKRQIPGLALVVIRDGQVTMMKGFGFANLEHDVPVHPDTVFELASTRNSSPRLPLWRLWNRAKSEQRIRSLSICPNLGAVEGYHDTPSFDPYSRLT